MEICLGKFMFYMKIWNDFNGYAIGIRLLHNYWASNELNAQ
jgi:hypothetical protein